MTPSPANPDRIYLQGSPGDVERTWCVDRIDAHVPDTEYVRADLYEALQQRLDQTQAALDNACDTLTMFTKGGGNG